MINRSHTAIKKPTRCIRNNIRKLVEQQSWWDQRQTLMNQGSRGVQPRPNNVSGADSKGGNHNTMGNISKTFHMVDRKIIYEHEFQLTNKQPTYE
jgi:hypothetical protein